jgi:hypothetical protein
MIEVKSGQQILPCIENRGLYGAPQNQDRSSMDEKAAGADRVKVQDATPWHWQV